MSVDMPDVAPDIATPLLAWYDRHARVLPWRSAPGTAPPDPYRVWLSEVMLQQTTVAAVTPYFERFVQRWPTVQALAAADEAEVMTAWAGLGYYSRARNLLAGARVVAASGGLPRTEAGLRALPGIGAYTGAAIAAIAFEEPAAVVDGNVERVVARLFAVADPLPAAKPRLRALTSTIAPRVRPGDFAQAMMDLGATVCTPHAPKCLICPLADRCSAFAEGDPASYPMRAAKPVKPGRRGTVWWVERAGAVLLVRRAARGLLGGMRGLPGDEWCGQTSGWTPPARGPVLGETTHVFTHFRLTLAVQAARCSEFGDPGCVLPPGGEWWPKERLDSAGLPTVFAKAARVAMQGD